MPTLLHAPVLVLVVVLAACFVAPQVSAFDLEQQHDDEVLIGVRSRTAEPCAKCRLPITWNPPGSPSTHSLTHSLTHPHAMINETRCLVAHMPRTCVRARMPTQCTRAARRTPRCRTRCVSSSASRCIDATSATCSRATRTLVGDIQASVVRHISRTHIHIELCHDRIKRWLGYRCVSLDRIDQAVPMIAVCNKALASVSVVLACVRLDGAEPIALEVSRSRSFDRALVRSISISDQ